MNKFAFIHTFIIISKFVITYIEVKFIFIHEDQCSWVTKIFLVCGDVISLVEVQDNFNNGDVINSWARVTQENHEHWSPTNINVLCSCTNK